MSPILGIWASQNYVRVTNSYESIQTVTVGFGGQATVTFSSIPNTYKHLQIRCIAKMTSGGGPFANRITFNSDTGTNYSDHNLNGSGASVSAGGAASTTYIRNWDFTGSGATNIFGTGVIDVLDYADTNKNKTVRCLSGYDANGSGSIFLSSGLWRSTSAISSMTFTPESGSYAQYSQFALYGIKG